MIGHVPDSLGEECTLALNAYDFIYKANQPFGSRLMHTAMLSAIWHGYTRLSYFKAWRVSMKHSLLISSSSIILPPLSSGASKLCSAPLLTLDRSELLALFLSCFTLLHFISKSLPSYQPFSSASYRILFFTVSVINIPLSRLRNAQNLILLS